MPRVIVTTDTPNTPESTSVLLDEHVQPVHLSSDHGAAQLVERIAWAISDAEDLESAPPRRPSSRGRSTRRSTPIRRRWVVSQRV